MSHQEQTRLGFQRIAEEIETVKSQIPDTTSAPIATTDDAANLASGFVDVFSASEAAKNGEVAATLGVVQSPPLAGTGGGETETPVKLVACRETLLFVNGILFLSKPGSCISGADEAGLEITSWQSVDTLGQQGALPLPINEQTGSDKVRSSLSFASGMTGTVKIWIPGATTPTWEGSLTRHSSKSPVSIPDDQTFPSGVRYFADAAVGQPSLPAGTRWQSDVPVYVVANYYDENNLTDTDETVLSSVTPENIRSETRQLADDLIYRRIIAPGGVESWSVA